MRKPTDHDGLRVQVDRLWPSGVGKPRAQLHEWCEEVVPSPEVRISGRYRETVVARVVNLNWIRAQIVDHPSNAWARRLGYDPVYAASPASKIAIIGQAPGRRAQESGTPWDDASGVALRTWLGVSNKDFYDVDQFAIIPMDFYYPGRGSHGDLPPRPAFAPLWHPQIFAELRQVRLTLLVGSYAQRYYLDGAAKNSVTQTVSNYQAFLPTQLPLVHPSPLNFRWQKQNPWFAHDVLPVLRSTVRQVLTTGRSTGDNVPDGTC